MTRAIVISKSPLSYRSIMSFL